MKKLLVIAGLVVAISACSEREYTKDELYNNLPLLQKILKDCHKMSVIEDLNSRKCTVAHHAYSKADSWAARRHNSNKSGPKIKTEYFFNNIGVSDNDKL